MTENESKFTHEEMQPMKVEYGENLSMTDISERLRGLVPHYEDPSDYTEDDLLIYQGANLIEAYKDEILRLRNTLDQTRRFALSGEMDKIASDEIERLRKALREMDQATISHVDGRDLLDQLQPNDHIDIKVRIDGGYDVYEGDWLNTLRDARNEARAALGKKDDNRNP